MSDVPDSWEDSSESGDSAAKMNVNAQEFVPSFLKAPIAEEPPKNEATKQPEPPEPVKEEAPIKKPPAEPEPTVSAEEITQKKQDKLDKIKSRKETVNVVFIGHVDAGKSTIGGHLMFLTGMVDQRTMEKYQREAKEKNRETWYLSWALDQNEEEREKGKTVECGRAYFETPKKHFTILDAPGHKSFVPNMITGASQADVAVLVISARKGEFETGFERGGQTREHAMLVKTAGVKHLVVLVNKMDDPTVKWDKERYAECVKKLEPFLKSTGFNLKNDVYFMPCSGYTGAFLSTKPEEGVCPWYNGPTLIQYLDDLPSVQRNAEGGLRLPIMDKYRDMGTILIGKIESGIVVKGESLVMMPNKTMVEIIQIQSDDVETDAAAAGEQVKLKVKGVEEEDVKSGFVLCDTDDLCGVGHVFDAQVHLLDCKSIVCAGFSAVMHIHSLSEEVVIKNLLFQLDKKTGDKKVKLPRFVRPGDAAIIRFTVPAGVVCLESFKEFPHMGRFNLRDEGKTVAVGKILKIVE